MVDATCAFCLQSFSHFNATKMRIYLTGEDEGNTRVMACSKIPTDCKTFAKHVGTFAQKLLTSCSSMGDVERCHKVTARTRTKLSNRKLDTTAEAYCTIAISKSSKRHREKATSSKVRLPNAMQVFRAHIQRSIWTRAEREATAQTIAAEPVRSSTSASDDDESDSHTGMEELLSDACHGFEDCFDFSSDEDF